MGVLYQQVSLEDRGVKRRLTLLQKACLPGDKLYFPEDGVWWMAYIRTTPVGFSCVTPSKQRDDTAYLGRCGVLPAYRGRGIQRQMIRLRVFWARRHHYKWAVSDTTDNIASANNLIACGFRLYVPEVQYSFARALYWRKKL